MTLTSDEFAELVGKDLAAVIFVRDYLQLQFDVGMMLSAYTRVTVRCGEQSATLGESAFANLLLGQIGKVVNSVGLRLNEALEIRLRDGSTVLISLRLEDYVGPEAMTLSGPDNELLVVRADS